VRAVSMWRAVSRRTSREIDAKDASLHDGPFVCINPSCGRPVTLHNTRPNPHFQHSRGKANPSCEYYGSRTGQISSFRISTSNAPRALGGREVPVLTFSGDPPADFLLSLRLPGPPAERIWDGSIVIHEHGERIVSFDQLKDPILHLRPKTEYAVTFRGDVPEEYRGLLRDIPGLRQDFNLFVYGIDAARLLEPYESIHADKDYWVLSKADLPSIGDPAWIRHSVAWHGWHVTLISLPSLRVMSNAQRAGVERVFQRPLHPDRFRAVILAPPPHHFFDSGIAVYSDDVEELQIALSESSKVDLLCDGERRGAIRCEPQQRICRAEFDRCGRWTLMSDGQRVLEWIKSETDFFEPPGINLSVGGEDIPLFSHQVQSWLEAQRADGSLLIRSPNAAVAASILVDNEPFPPASLEMVLPHFADREHWIDAGNFGRLTYSRRAKITEIRRELDDVKAKVTWLKGIALHAKCVGPHRLRGIPEPEAPGWIAELKHMGWASSFIAQIRDIEDRLIRTGVWRAQRP
jgi:hypothetical protein